MENREDFYDYFLSAKKHMSKIKKFHIDDRFNDKKSLKDNGTNRLFIGESDSYETDLETKSALKAFYPRIQKAFRLELENDDILTYEHIRIMRTAVTLSHPIKGYKFEFVLYPNKFGIYLRNNTLTVEESLETVEEAYVFTKDDLYINFEKFENGKSNVCIVTGLSGSGKSTLANSMASKYKAEWIELDLFEHCYGMTDKQLQQAGQVFYDYLSSHKKVWDKLKERTLRGKELGEEISKFVHYCISWCKKDKSKKYIIEGVQIYSFMKFKEVKSYPLVLKNTSMLKSIIQRWKRNGDGKMDLVSELKNEFPQFVSWYMSEEKSLNRFRNSIIEESAGK